ncbi:terminase small subunit [Novosphingobium sp. B1]|uniref:terminase small subunit n=1 Tax=Novosphingobium sp. B1 TaxID=1938756 RepID=UPI0009D853A2|nr:terminase small subunit [Novosphingobium sp. B1]SMD02201.1 Terminase small subunit [Novosphingobium sp. B1]
MSLTPKQEAFALAYIETGNASEAYRRAYDAARMKDATVNRKAKELLDNGKITARVDELKAEHAERHAVTVDAIAAMLREDREFARKCATPAAAVSATMGLAKLYGHLREKVEHTGKDGKDLPAPPPAIAIFALPDNGRDTDALT